MPEPAPIRRWRDLPVAHGPELDRWLGHAAAAPTGLRGVGIDSQPRVIPVPPTVPEVLDLATHIGRAMRTLVVDTDHLGASRWAALVVGLLDAVERGSFTGDLFVIGRRASMTPPGAPVPGVRVGPARADGAVVAVLDPALAGPLDLEASPSATVVPLLASPSRSGRAVDQSVLTHRSLLERAGVRPEDVLLAPEWSPGACYRSIAGYLDRRRTIGAGNGAVVVLGVASPMALGAILAVHEGADATVSGAVVDPPTPSGGSPGDRWGAWLTGEPYR